MTGTQQDVARRVGAPASGPGAVTIPHQRRYQDAPLARPHVGAAGLPTRLPAAPDATLPAPARRRRRGANPDAARLLLCGLLLFGALVSQLSKPEPPLRELPPASAAQHGTPRPTSR